MGFMDKFKDAAQQAQHAAKSAGGSVASMGGMGGAADTAAKTNKIAQQRGQAPGGAARDARDGQQGPALGRRRVRARGRGQAHRRRAVHRDLRQQLIGPSVDGYKQKIGGRDRRQRRPRRPAVDAALGLSGGGPAEGTAMSFDAARRAALALLARTRGGRDRGERRRARTRLRPTRRGAARPDRDPRPARLPLGAARQHGARRGLRRGPVDLRRPRRPVPDRVSQPAAARPPAGALSPAARPGAAARPPRPAQHARRRRAEHLGPLRPRRAPVRGLPRPAPGLLVRASSSTRTPASRTRSWRSSSAPARRSTSGPDDHLLEIGTGWGGLAIHAAATRGCRVTTTTISRHQHDYARERVRAEGLADRVEVLLTDYRDLAGTYDKLVSIEMIEAVGWQYFPAFFEKCAELTKPGRSDVPAGDRDRRPPLRAGEGRPHVRQQARLPGRLPAVAGADRRARRAATGCRSSAPWTSAPTTRGPCACGGRRFNEAWPDLRPLGYDERFARLWNFYLASSEAGFRRAPDRRRAAAAREAGLRRHGTTNGDRPQPTRNRRASRPDRRARRLAPDLEAGRRPARRRARRDRRRPPRLRRLAGAARGRRPDRREPRRRGRRALRRARGRAPARGRELARRLGRAGAGEGRRRPRRCARSRRPGSGAGRSGRGAWTLTRGPAAAPGAAAAPRRAARPRRRPAQHRRAAGAPAGARGARAGRRLARRARLRGRQRRDARPRLRAARAGHGARRRSPGARRTASSARRSPSGCRPARATSSSRASGTRRPGTTRRGSPSCCSRRASAGQVGSGRSSPGQAPVAL